MTAEDLTRALQTVLESPNVSDSNLEPANVVDVMAMVASSLDRIAAGILCQGTAPGEDASGGMVNSMIEATMGITAGLCKVAESISEVATAIQNRTDFESTVRRQP